MPDAKKSPMPKAKTKSASTNVYAVLGSDEAEVKRVAAELATQLTPPETGDFGLEVIDGVAESAEQATARIRSTIEALQTLPFFGSTKVVWLKNANFLGDTAIARSASVQSALEELSDLVKNGPGSDVIFRSAPLKWTSVARFTSRCSNWRRRKF
jgi:DNA polymerase III, delta subunit